ncbi:hypothetical protein [Ferrimicrobium acidiphilum]|uniref:hypothetical protein n=1 Tax=Ferrimicrobium acidiphilum TaxID=121039 RepID=UPI0023F2E5EB|nr:hypothetical protein [Ferrimicrobium acidiphilum]
MTTSSVVNGSRCHFAHLRDTDHVTAKLASVSSDRGVVITAIAIILALLDIRLPAAL